MIADAAFQRLAVGLVALDRVGSTNDEALRLARAGQDDPTLVTAAVQTDGRGRRGRSWRSPEGNFHGSFLLRPAIALARVPEIGFVAGIAAVDAIGIVTTGRAAPTLKWPNDLLLDGRKLGGILVEADGADDASRAIAVGIGINLASAPEGMPYPTASLVDAAPVTPAEFGPVLADRFMAWHAHWRAAGFDAIRAAWMDRTAAVGTAVRVIADGEAIEGRHAGIDGAGALLIDQPSGRRRIVAGDVLPVVA